MFNIWLSFRLLNVQICPCYNDLFNKTTSTVKDFVPPFNQKSNITLKNQIDKNLAFSNINFNLGRWDNQRMYKYYDFASIGSNFVNNKNNKVCLATQSSVERLHFLIQVANNWNGPISIAVYADCNQEFHVLQHYVTFLQQCSSAISRNVNFHLAVPKDRIPINNNINTIEWLKSENHCKTPEKILKKLLKLNTKELYKYGLKNIYPQNHLRNLARKGCLAENVFLTDVDIIPSLNLANQLEVFFKTIHCIKLCAYVIPTYEIDTRAKFPESKKELIRLEKKGLARPFHKKVFIYNQYATNFSKWQQDDSDEEIHISHNVTNYEFLYEPFYVSSDKVPVHDERFLGYGFTRNSQVYEMFIAGYIFQVITPAFTCHWGLQQKKHRPAWREQQNNINSKKFERFKKEIFVRFKNVTLSINEKKKYKIK